jgi:hypothetical protein
MLLLTVKHYKVLLRLELLLCNEREMGGYTRAISRQQLGKHVPMLGTRFLIMQWLDCNNGRAVFSMWSVLRCYKQGTRSVDGQFCMGVCEEGT